MGISVFYHDSAVALLRHGIIIAAAQEQEERLLLRAWLHANV